MVLEMRIALTLILKFKKKIVFLIFVVEGFVNLKTDLLLFDNELMNLHQPLR